MTNSEKFVSQVNPSALAHYLRGKGWVQFKIRRIDIEIYQYLMDGQLLEQVTIPIDKELFDYSEALYGQIQAIAEVLPTYKNVPAGNSPSRDFFVSVTVRSYFSSLNSS